MDVVQGSTANDPTAPGTFDANLEYQNSIGSVLANVGFNSDTDYSIINRVHGGSIILQAEDAAGAVQSILDGDPDTDTRLFYAGAEKLATLATGISVTGDVGGTTIGGITQANLVDKSAAEDVTGDWRFTGPLDVIGDINTATPPVAEAITSNIRFADADNTDTIGQAGFLGSNVLTLRNVMHGGAVLIDAEDAAGVARTILSADPDAVTTLRGDTDLILENAAGTAVLTATGGGTTVMGAATNLELEVAAGETAFAATANSSSRMYYNNIHRITAASGGIAQIRSDGNTDGEDRALYFAHQDGTERGHVGYLASGGFDALRVHNSIHSGHLLLVAEDAGGVFRNILNSDPDGPTSMTADSNFQINVNAGEPALVATANSDIAFHFNAEEVARTKTSLTGGFEIENNLTGGGFERVATETDIGIHIVKDADEVVTTSITLQDDNDFVNMALVTDKRYELIAHFVVSDSTTGDFDYAWIFTNAPISGGRSSHVTIPAAGGTDNGNTPIATRDQVTLGTGTNIVKISAHFQSNASTGGTFKLQWCQGSSAGTTTLHQGSWLRLRQLD
jgi:hypothetical protein